MYNSVGSPSFKGVKYYNYNNDVVNTWFNYRMKQDRSSISQIERIVQKQKDNPHHIILDYYANGDSNNVVEKATVDGKDFVRFKFESVRHMLKRAANYADSLRKTPAQPLENENRLNDFVVEKTV